MTRDEHAPTHACPGGCGRQVAQHLFACKADWFRLPKPYRDEIWRAYRRGTAAEHAAAMMAAEAWYEQNAEPGHQPTP